MWSIPPPIHTTEQKRPCSDAGKLTFAQPSGGNKSHQLATNHEGLEWKSSPSLLLAVDRFTRGHNSSNKVIRT